jgi:hypothetical protein
VTFLLYALNVYKDTAHERSGLIEQGIFKDKEKKMEMPLDTAQKSTTAGNIAFLLLSFPFGLLYFLVTVIGFALGLSTLLTTLPAKARGVLSVRSTLPISLV